MSKSASEPKILLDADVTRHFIQASKQLYLPKIYPHRLVMIDIVKNELCRSKWLKTPVENFIDCCKIELLTINNNIEVQKEYATLKKQFDDGESACMALAKFEKQYIASSNLRDIRNYCEINGITYLTTSDILLDALLKGIMTPEECNEMIKINIAKGSKFPFLTIEEFALSKK
ncbi:MAG: hypothetical protein GXX85_12685 [Ignavibacteria bacterium]|nr:hypothetical protein [Ignavibacteria bacterium]